MKLTKFSIIGISGGGPYAAVCADRIPQRLTTIGIVVGLAPTYIPGVLNGMSWVNKFGWSHFSSIPLLAQFSSELHSLEVKSSIPFLMRYY